MKFLRFLWGFICGVWTLIIAAIGFIVGGIVGYGLTKDTEPKRQDYGRISYSDYRKGS